MNVIRCCSPFEDCQSRFVASNRLHEDIRVTSILLELVVNHSLDILEFLSNALVSWLLLRMSAQHTILALSSDFVLILARMTNGFTGCLNAEVDILFR